MPRFCADYGYKQCLNCLRWLCSKTRKQVGWRELRCGFFQYWYVCQDWDMECEWKDGLYVTDAIRRHVRTVLVVDWLDGTSASGEWSERSWAVRATSLRAVRPLGSS